MFCLVKTILSIGNEFISQWPANVIKIVFGIDQSLTLLATDNNCVLLTRNDISKCIHNKVWNRSVVSKNKITHNIQYMSESSLQEKAVHNISNCDVLFEYHKVTYFAKK